MDWPAPLLALGRSPVALGHALGYRDFTEDLHGAAWNWFQGKDRAFAMWPRDHRKTTFFSEICPLWMKLRDVGGRYRLNITSAELGLSHDIIRKIADLTEARLDLPGWSGPPRRLSEFFPWLRVAKFSEQRGIHFAHRGGTNKEACIFPGSVGAKSGTGRHPTHVICDDLSNFHNSRTGTQRQKVVDYFTSLTPMMESLKCPIWIVGTPWEFGDIAFHARDILGIPTFWRSALSGAVPDDAGGPEDQRRWQGKLEPGETGWPLLPHVMGVRELAWLTDPQNPKRIPARDFYRWYRCVHIGSDMAFFQRDILDAATDSSMPASGGYDLILIDPTNTDHEGAHPNGIVVVRVLTAQQIGYTKFDPTTNVFCVLHAEALHGGLEALDRRLPELCQEYPGVRAAFIEAFEFQVGIQPWIQKELPNGVSIESVPGLSNRKSKEVRAMGLHTAIIRGRVLFPPDFPGRKALMAELLRYTGGKLHCDLLDALAFVGMLPTDGAIVDPIPVPPVEGTIGWQRIIEDSVTRGLRVRRW